MLVIGRFRRSQLGKEAIDIVETISPDPYGNWLFNFLGEYSV